MFDNKISILKLLFLFLLFIFGVTIRFYNINYEDFWTDEIFAFFTSEPNISFNETLIRTLDTNFNSLFDFLLKEFHSLFGYDVYVSRYFSLILSFLTLLVFAALFYKISSYSSLAFGLFIISINIFHIRYSTEVRSYILTFLLVLIFIYLNFKNKDTEYQLNFKRLLAIIFVSILMLLSHAFTLLVLGSLILFKLIKIFKYKKINLFEVYLILGLAIVSMLYLLVYLPLNMQHADQLIGISPHWIKHVKPSFYTNYFFSQYFGSRLLGLIYLLILIYLILKFKNNLYKNFNIYSFFIILIFCSYLIPLTYGYLFGPILIGRYIMFVLIPIICLISHFLFLIENKFIKYFLIILICLTTSINHIFFENTFRQFYTNINHTKPQIKDAFKTINNSEVKFFTVKKKDAKEKNLNESYENYIKKYLERLKFNLNYVNYGDDEMPRKFWIIDIRDAYKDNLVLNENLENYEIIQKLYFNSLELFLVVNKNN
tara:strand:+ start:1552 stop:3009 length:1458 start_codon:yes stop_codon:yes gene_type:complete